MRKAYIPVLIAGIFFIAYTSFAESPPALDRNLILTEGTAEVTGQNDSARISIAVVTEGRHLEQVSSDNAEKTKRVLKAVKGLNIKNLKFKTSDYRVTPQRDYKARPPKIKGYEVRNTIEVTLEGFEPEHLARHTSIIVGKALESGANNIHNIQFYIKNKQLLEKEALTQATLKAIDRAGTLARAAGVKLKRIVSLSSYPTHMPPRPHLFRAAGMESDVLAGAPPIETGESKIRVQVSVAYEIE